MQTLHRVRIRTEVHLLEKKLISSENFQLPTVLKFLNMYFVAFLLLKNLLYHLLMNKKDQCGQQCANKMELVKPPFYFSILSLVMLPCTQVILLEKVETIFK